MVILGALRPLKKAQRSHMEHSIVIFCASSLQIVFILPKKRYLDKGENKIS